MQNEKFVEHAVDNNCKMLYSLTSTEEDYIADEKHKDDVVMWFMNQIKTDMYANEIEVIHPQIDKGNNRIIMLHITLINGNISKNLIRGVINQGLSF
jgi:hypothetical protein